MRTYPALFARLPRWTEHSFDILAAAVDGFDVRALDQAAEEFGAYFIAAEERDAAVDALRRQFPDAQVRAADVPDENWAERSQAGLTPVRAGNLVIAPPWDVPDDLSNVVIIEPSTGFGTGHHATTRLCLQALQESAPAGKSIIDAGTGSGVLALAAKKLGAARVIGIDNDPDAIANARENMALNDVDIDLRRASLERVDIEPADIVVANLTGAVLIRFRGELSGLRRHDGRLIVSGLRDEEEADVARAFGGHPVARAAEEGWICLTF